MVAVVDRVAETVAVVLEPPLDFRANSGAEQGVGVEVAGGHLVLLQADRVEADLSLSLIHIVRLRRHQPAGLPAVTGHYPAGTLRDSRGHQTLFRGVSDIFLQLSCGHSAGFPRASDNILRPFCGILAGGAGFRKIKKKAA